MAEAPYDEVITIRPTVTGESDYTLNQKLDEAAREAALRWNAESTWGSIRMQTSCACREMNATHAVRAKDGFRDGPNWNVGVL